MIRSYLTAFRRANSLDQLWIFDNMAGLKVIVFALSIVVATANDALVPPSSCSLNNARYLPIYGKH